MRDEDLDRILSRETGIVPSSGFVASVMEAVRSEASTPPPIPFPWKRAIPGLAAWGVALVSAVLASGTKVEHATPAWPSNLGRLLEAAEMVGAGWITLALLLTWASVKLSMRLTGGRG